MKRKYLGIKDVFVNEYEFDDETKKQLLEMMREPMELHFKIDKNGEVDLQLINANPFNTLNNINAIKKSVMESFSLPDILIKLVEKNFASTQFEIEEKYE